MAKKFNFRLERVLKYRHQQQRQAEQRQREAFNMLLSAQEREAEVKREFDEASDSTGLVGRVFDPVALSNAVDHLAAIDSRLKKAGERVENAQRVFDQAETEWAETTKETEILKTLREQKMFEHQRKNELEQQTAVDENVMRKWSRHQSDVPQAKMPDEDPGEPTW